MLGSKPEFEDFLEDEHIRTFFECWFHKWFGGAIFLPVTLYENVRNKHNYLKEYLTSLNNKPEDYDYFIMTEVIADDTNENDTFYDIELLFLPSHQMTKREH